jgi:hypothetical protein
MKVWKCKDGVVFLNKDMAVSYSLEYGLAANGQEAGFNCTKVELTNDSRFAVMGTYNDVLIFRLLGELTWQKIT